MVSLLAGRTDFCWCCRYWLGGLFSAVYFCCWPGGLFSGGVVVVDRVVSCLLGLLLLVGRPFSAGFAIFDRLACCPLGLVLAG